MPTIVSIAREVSDAKFAEIGRLLDREALRNVDWNGVEFRLVRGDYNGGA